jgi:hypothetical protein
VLTSELVLLVGVHFTCQDLELAWRDFMGRIKSLADAIQTDIAFKIDRAILTVDEILGGMRVVSAS